MKGRAEIQFGLLGPLIAAPEGAPVPIGSSRQRTILGILLVNANQVVVTDRMIDLVWEGGPPRSARSALQVHISHLRTALGRDLIVTTPNGYKIDLPRAALDFTVYEDLFEQARTVAGDDPEKAVSLLRDAIGLWRGQPLLDFAFESWAQPEIRRMEELRVEVMTELFEARLAIGERGLAAEIEQMAADYPYRERLQSLLAQALYREGRQTAALRSLETARGRFREDLGLDLSPELRSLEQRILEQSDDLDSVAISHRLPTAATSFVGRSSESAELAKLLTEKRIVTVVGPGGVGKSRLVLEESWRLASGGDDVRWVPLASVESPDLVDQQVLQAVAIGETPGHTARDSLILGIGGRELTLVFDAAEHLLASVSDLITILLQRCPRLRIVATSRERLKVPDETVLGLEPLPFDDGLDGAVDLLIHRIRTVEPTASEEDFDRQELSRLCAALDGLPLAIEIVAARVSDLGVAKVTEEIISLPETHLMSERLVATIQFSYDLLGPDARRMFELTSIFMGSFDLDAARHVAGAIRLEPGGVLDWLSLLVDKSLLGTESTQVGRRYRMLDTIRAFAASQLEGPDREAVAGRHANYYMELAIGFGQALRGGPGQPGALLQLDSDLPNLTAAASRVGAGEPELILGAAWELLPYWMARTRSVSGYDFTRLGRPLLNEVSAATAVRALTAEAWLAELAKDQDVAHGVAEEALTLARASASEVEYLALFAVAHANFNGRAPAIAVETGPHAAQLAAEAGDDWIEGWAWMTAGTASYEIGDLVRSVPALEKALEILSRIEDVMGMAWTIWCLGVAARHLGRFDEFEERMTDALGLFQRIGDGFGVTIAVWGIAEAAFVTGDLERAKAFYRRSLEHDLEVIPPDNEAAVFGRLALIALEEDAPDEVPALLAEAADRLPGFSVWAAADICLPLAIWAFDEGQTDRFAPLVFAALDRFHARGLEWEPDMRRRWGDVLHRLEVELGPKRLAAARSTSDQITQSGLIAALKSELG